MSHFLILPVMLPIATALVLLLFRTSRKWEGRIASASAFALWIFSLFLIKEVHERGILVLHLANWQPPFGVIFVADLLSSLMLALSATIALGALVYSLQGTAELHQKALYFPLTQFLFAGVNGAFLSGDIFNLFVFYEIFLISSYILVTLGAEKEQLRQGVKYISINLVGSTLFLAGVGLIYGLTGSWNMADIARRVAEVNDPWLVTAVAFIFLVVFSLKSAAFPLYFWLPDSYPHLPRGINIFFAGILTKVGIYSLIRVFSLIFRQEIAWTHSFLIFLAGLTMLFGVLGALCQWEYKKLLSFHIISQIGYLLMGLGLFTLSSLAGALFFMIHIVVVKSLLFLLGAITEKITGTSELKAMSGLVHDFPLVSFLFLLAGLGIAGVPPLSGFVAKFTLIQAGLESKSYWVVTAALVTSLLTLYSMMKIWSTIYWGEKKGVSSSPLCTVPVYRRLILSPIPLAGFVIGMGVFAEPFYRFSYLAASQILEPSQYIRAVFP